MGVHTMSQCGKAVHASPKGPRQKAGTHGGVGKEFIGTQPSGSPGRRKVINVDEITKDIY